MPSGNLVVRNQQGQVMWASRHIRGTGWAHTWNVDQGTVKVIAHYDPSQVLDAYQFKPGEQVSLES
jgi:hypothetical protein